jgi:heptosyltransferase-1
VVDLQGLLKSALPSRWAGAKTHGYDARSIREPFASAFYDVRHTVSWSLHAVERNRALMAAALGLPAPTGPALFGLSAPPRAAGAYGVILHSASWPSKLWPEDRWRALLAARTDLPFRIPWGDEAERARAERLAAGLAHVSVLPERLTREELAAFLGGARAVIGLDTGLMHLAHAVGAPTVWLFGSTSPDRTGPHGPGAVVLTSTVPAAPCMRRECRHEGGDCMEGVAVSAVLEALGGLLVAA